MSQCRCKQNNQQKVFEKLIQVLQINQFVSMNDKQKLIDSMSNLIYHVSSSRKNQQQIFATLSIGDLNKIISNLEDTSQKLRKTTLILLSQLLYQNPILQKKFCELTNVYQITGKVVLSSSFPKSILFDKDSLTQVMNMMKDNSNLKQKGLFWYIDGHSKQKILQIGKRNSYIPDPLTSIVGLWINVQKKNPKIQPDISVRQPDGLVSRTQIKNQSNQKYKLNRSINYERNGYSDIKPETPMTSHKINLSDAMMTQSLKYRPNLYAQTYTPVTNKSAMRIQVPRIVYTNTTQRKNYDPMNYDPVKTTRPVNYQSYTTPLTSTHQQHMHKNVELFPTMTSTTVSLNSNKMVTQAMNGQFPRQQYRNR